MKILVVSQYYYPESFAITGLCEGLVRLGHQVQVLTSKPQYGFGQVPKDYAKITDEVISGVNIHRVHTFPRKQTFMSTLLNYLTFYRHANRAIAHLPGRYDIVLSVSLSPLMSITPAIQYAKKHQLPHLLYAVDVWPDSLLANPKIREKSWLYQSLKKWSDRLYRQVDQILVGSPSYIPHFRKRFGKDKVIGTALIQPALIETGAKDIFDYGEGFHLVYTGNIGTIQTLMPLLQQWPTLPKHYHLHLIGSGSQLPTFKTWVHQHKMQHQIHFYAHQTPDTLVKFFTDADALYVGLKLDGIVGKTIPHKLIQYLTVGKPILSQLQGDGLALLKQIGTPYGLNEKASNLKTLIQKISRLTEAEKEEIRLGHQQYYQQHLSLNTASKSLETHLISLIKSVKS